MPLRLCQNDPLLTLARRRFEGLNVLGTPTPSLRPLTVIALQRRGDPIELGALSAMVDDPSALDTEPPVELEPLPDLAGRSSQRFGMNLAARLLPGLLGAFGADASAVAQAAQTAEFTLSFGGVRALRVDRARLGRALGALRLSAGHPHAAWLASPGVRFAVVDRVIVADEIDVKLHRAGGAALQGAGPDPQGLAQVSIGARAEHDQTQRITSRAAAPVVLSWSCLVYSLGQDGRIGAFRGEVAQLDGEAELGERVTAWGADEAGRVGAFGERPTAEPAEHLGVTQLMVSGDMLFRAKRLPPAEPTAEGETGQYGPTYSGGPAAIMMGNDLVGLNYTAASTASTTEDQLLRRRSSGASYPKLAPLTGDGPRDGVAVVPTNVSFSSRAAFLDDAWDELGPCEGDTVYHVRANARRYTVTNVSALATALAGAQSSEWVDKLVERNSSNQVVNVGWVYVEVFAYDGTIHRRVHQLTPSGMTLPPSTNLLTLEPGPDMSLSELITEHVSTGWKYAVANIEASVVSGGPLTASPPAAPPLWGSTEGVST